MRFSSFCCIFLVQLKSATYQSIGSSLGFFILLGALFYSRKKNYLPQFWSPCFVVLPLLLVRLYLFKIRRGICIVCNTKAVGCARACICISNISLFTGLELKLKSFRLAANITSLFCWSFFAEDHTSNLSMQFHFLLRHDIYSSTEFHVFLVNHATLYHRQYN